MPCVKVLQGGVRGHAARREIAMEQGARTLQGAMRGHKTRNEVQGEFDAAASRISASVQSAADSRALAAQYEVPSDVYLTPI